MDEMQQAVEAIKRKLIGKTLTYHEIYAIMDEIAHERLGQVLTTYFAASSFKEGFSDEELYYLTKAMVETGQRLQFQGIVADKHSVGGVAGTRTSMIVVPIVAAAGFYIPKNSSRAITSPAGTADTMEVLCPVTFAPSQVQTMVEKTGGCIVWSGKLGLAPADDVMIAVEEPLGAESYDKMLVAIMAKKIASGATHVVFDVPLGPEMKIQHQKDADIIKRKLTYLAKKFSMQVIIDVNHMSETAGFGVGPVLEARDILQILEQRSNRSLVLEEKALHIAGELLQLCFDSVPSKKGTKGHQVARELLQSGIALAKFREIIASQGGNPAVSSQTLLPGKEQYELKARSVGKVTAVHNKKINTICRILGCPEDKAAGVLFHFKRGAVVEQGDILCTLYSSDAWRLKEAIESMKYLPLLTIA